MHNGLFILFTEFTEIKVIQLMENKASRTSTMELISIQAVAYILIHTFSI